jgi:phosphate-selective porin OprO and OprP
LKLFVTKICLAACLVLGWAWLGDAAPPAAAPAEKPPEETPAKSGRGRILDFDKGFRNLYGLASGGEEAEVGSDSVIYWDNGLVIESWVRGRFKFIAGFWCGYDLGYMDPDSKVKAAYPDTGSSGGEFRRFRIYFKGHFLNLIQYRFQVDITGDAEDRVDLWAGLKNIPEGGYIRLGYQKEPFSLEYMTSSQNNTFMERSLADALAPGRNWGLQFMTPLWDRRLTLAAGFASESDSFTDSLSGARDFTTRVTGLAWYENQGAELLHLGLNYSYRPTDSTVNYSSRPESYLATSRLVNTGDFQADQTHNLGLEAVWLRGPLSVQGEIITSFANAEDGQKTFGGFYLQGSYFLTGEQRPYNRNLANFGRVRPKQEFDLRGDGWGAWETAARISYLDLNSGSVHGGREFNLTLGLNWYWSRHIRVMLNYVRASVMDQPTLEGGDGIFQCLQTRLQFYF